MSRFLVTYHASDIPHDPEAMANARQASCGPRRRARHSSTRVHRFKAC